jgi:hypothetical protein
MMRQVGQQLDSLKLKTLSSPILVSPEELYTLIELELRIKPAQLKTGQNLLQS